MKVVVNQSNYLPWKGYFDLIRDADVFVFYDDVQFTKNDWRNRNRLMGPRGPEWLSIPVGGNLRRRVCDVALPVGGWRGAHWRKLEEYYSSAPFFRDYSPGLRDMILDDSVHTLSELNQRLIRLIAGGFLGIRTEFRDSKAYVLRGTGQERLLDLLQQVGARTYISGPAGKAYLQPERFAEAGIELIWKDYSGYPEYPQLHAPFEHAVSVVDLLFNLGPSSPEYIWGWRNGPIPR